MLRLNLFLLYFIPLLLLAGGPWLPGKKKGYAQISYTYNQYSRVFLPQNEGTLLRSVTDNTLQGYVEYGLSNKWAVTGILPFKLLSTGKDVLPSSLYTNPLASGSLNAFGNPSIAMKRKLTEKGIVSALQFMVELPVASVDTSLGLRTGYSGFSFVPTYLIGVGGKKFYTYLELGPAFRTANYNPEFRTVFEIGWRPEKKLWIAFVLNNKSIMRSTTRNEGNAMQTFMYVNGQKYSAWGLKASYGLTDKIGINASGYGAFSAQNVAAAPTLYGGVYYKW